MATTVSEPLACGEKFTIGGFSLDRWGRLLIDGKAVATGRKCKPVRQAVFVVTYTLPGAKKRKGGGKRC